MKTALRTDGSEYSWVCIRNCNGLSKSPSTVTAHTPHQCAQGFDFSSFHSYLRGINLLHHAEKKMNIVYTKVRDRSGGLWKAFGSNPENKMKN